MTSYKERIADKLDIDPFLTYGSALADVLREDIMSCHLRPGVRVREQEVSTSADVSRTTVRKAFEILIYEGLLERSDSQHLHVAGLDFKDDRNLRDFRIMIEPTAAGYAAQRRKQKDLEAMLRWLDIQRQTRDPKTYIDADMSFHTAVVKATYNPYLINSVQGYLNGVYRLKQYYANKVVGAFCRRIEGDHTAIYTAIEAGDGAAASEAALAHVRVPYVKLYQEKYGEEKNTKT